MKIIEGRVRVAASDVANFLACQQLTQLDLRMARGQLRPPHAVDVGFEDLVRRGEEHERAVWTGTAAGDAGRQEVVAGYNEDDCRATLALRDWLEDRRLSLAERTGGQLPRPVAPQEAARRPRARM